MNVRAFEFRFLICETQERVVGKTSFSTTDRQVAEA